MRSNIGYGAFPAVDIRKFDYTVVLGELKRKISTRGYWLFEVILMSDLDGDSLISPTELQHLLDLLQIPHLPGDVEALFAALDENDDGQINLKELKAGMEDSNKGTEFSNRGTTDTITKKMFDNQNPQRLEVQGSATVTDAEIFALLEKWQDQIVMLEYVNLSRTRLSDKALNAIVRSCPRLRVLILSDCKNITNDGIEYASRHCFHLQCINLVGCDSVSKVEPLLRNNIHLRGITLDGATQLSNSAIISLCNHCQEVDVVDVQCCAALTVATLENLIVRFSTLNKSTNMKRIRLHGECTYEVLQFVQQAQDQQRKCTILNHLAVRKNPLLAQKAG